MNIIYAVSLVSRPKKRCLIRAEHFAVRLQGSFGDKVLELLATGLKLQGFDTWVGEAEVSVVQSLSSQSELDAALLRIRSVTETPSLQRYRLLKWNCEDFARFVVLGEPRSKQREAVGEALLYSSALLLLLEALAPRTAKVA